MPNLGNSTTPAGGVYEWDQPNAQIATLYTMPSGGGTVSDVYVFIASDPTYPGVYPSYNPFPATIGQVCLWDSNGNLLYTSASQTLTFGTRTAGGQAWVHVSGLSVFVPAGNFYVGFWINPGPHGTSGLAVWTTELVTADTSVDTHTYYTQNIVAPGYLAIDGVLGAGGLGAYVTYTAGGGGGGSPVVHIFRASVWTTASAFQIFRASAWSSLTLQMERSSAWTTPT